jgi:cyd operon protein YbgE
MTGALAEPRRRGAGRDATRIVSFALATGLALTLTVYPNAALGASGKPSHGLLALLLWGVAAGFIHGVGFTPRARVWRIAFSPWVALPLMVLGALMLVRNVVG